MMMMIDRRQFVRQTAAVTLGTLSAHSVLAQQNAHTEHTMPGMSGHDMNTMQAMLGMEMETAPLAPLDVLPTGAELPALRKLANESTQADFFRASLIAHPVQYTLIPGKPTSFWQYDSITGTADAPGAGPMIAVREGDTVEIPFINRLPQASTIHWHGLPVPPEQDGGPGGLVAPGATRVYRFTLPLGSAGTYWYHPHPHGMTAEQVFRGLAGPFIVYAKDDPLRAWPERHLLISDLKLAQDGTIAENSGMDWMNGREGQFMLINGVRRPRITLTGDERWRVWNACSARYLRLSFTESASGSGTAQARAFAQVGTDGGLLESPRMLDELLLAPGERAELIIPVGARAASAMLHAQPYDRGKMMVTTPDPMQVLADLSFAPAGEAAGRTLALPARLRTIPPLGKPVARKQVVFSEQIMKSGTKHKTPGRQHDGSSMPGKPPVSSPRAIIASNIAFMVNGAVFQPGRITLTSKRSAVEMWSIVNRSDMDHPFHLHGTQFQVLARERNGVRTTEPYRAWRDTVNVRSNETVYIATVQHFPGPRLFHCHVLEHEDLGMMGTLRVV